VAEISWRKRNPALHRLSGRRAPVLEQNSTSGRLTGVAFIVIFGAAAFWGVRALFGLPH